MRDAVTRSGRALALALLVSLAWIGCSAIERESKRSEAYDQMRSGDLALEQERYEDARDAFGRALAILKSIEDTAGMASALVGRGMAWAGLHRHGEAVNDFEGALELHAAEGAVGDPWRGMVQSLVGESRSAFSQWAEAVAAYEEALRIYEGAYGPADPRLVRSLASLAWSWNVRGDYQKAQTYLDRASAITGKPGFDDAMLKAGVMFSRADLLTRVGRYAEALDQARRALDLARSRLAPDHPFVGSLLNSVGYGYLRTGDAQQALDQFRASLEIFESQSGPKSLDASTVTDSVGEALRELGRFEESLAMHEKALGVRRSFIDRDTDGTAWMIDNIGRAKAGLGRLEEAIVDFDRAASMTRAIHGPGHPDEARELRHKGSALCSLGRADEARRNLEQALEILERRVGADHPDAVDTRKLIESCGAASGAHVAGPV
jgi:tetratricopeptide (TPR) repeat protein